MKRDLDLIRRLLLDLEADKSGRLRTFTNEEHGPETVYQLALLADAGYVKTAPPFKGGTTISEMTWEGHDFLDGIRDDTVWKKITKRVKTTSGTATLAVIKALAEE